MNLPSLISVIRQHPTMSIRELTVLFSIHDAGGKMRFDQIASNLGVPKPSISRAFDALWAKRMIERKLDTMDARRVYAVMTDVGKKFIRGLR